MLLVLLTLQNKWKDMFPTIVMKARTIEVIDAGILGGLLHLVNTYTNPCSMFSQENIMLKLEL